MSILSIGSVMRPRNGQLGGNYAENEVYSNDGAMGRAPKPASTLLSRDGCGGKPPKCGKWRGRERASERGKRPNSSLCRVRRPLSAAVS